MATRQAKDAAYDMLVWIESNGTSVHQALVMAAESNEEDARRFAGGDQDAISKLMKESGQAWRKRAAEFQERYEKTADPDDLGLV